MWQVGITEIFADGSFVEDKDHPNDIDGYFNCDLKHLASGRLEQELNLLDPHKVWTWDPASRRKALGFSKRQLPMWHRYRVEWKVSSALYVIFDALGIAVPVPQLKGAPFAYPQYRTAIGIELAF